MHVKRPPLAPDDDELLERRGGGEHGAEPEVAGAVEREVHRAHGREREVRGEALDPFARVHRAGERRPGDPPGELEPAARPAGARGGGVGGALGDEGDTRVGVGEVEASEMREEGEGREARPIERGFGLGGEMVEQGMTEAPVRPDDCADKGGRGCPREGGGVLERVWAERAALLEAQMEMRSATQRVCHEIVSVNTLLVLKRQRLFIRYETYAFKRRAEQEGVQGGEGSGDDSVGVRSVWLPLVKLQMGNSELSTFQILDSGREYLIAEYDGKNDRGVSGTIEQEGAELSVGFENDSAPGSTDVDEAKERSNVLGFDVHPRDCRKPPEGWEDSGVGKQNVTDEKKDILWKLIERSDPGVTNEALRGDWVLPAIVRVQLLRQKHIIPCWIYWREVG
ncbi:uncharacterized protein BXZ73DRAFT_77495 [Epithele typhae]|uniref:uncharacterized protein n=1 Tax=Epithele typhae TaxID=378194 RepID=UPI002008A7F3|nr:uncharacterized protein BXZ73DRAFT_77495 [Epithele typhae]KAH9932804.1 hypothetical protein BXZ73DRAFT_77495 [Epithele typhae]